MDKQIPVFAVSGFANSGKTTMVVKIIEYLKKKGIKVATIKHDGHDNIVEQQGKDTWKHHQAGAEMVAITSASKIMLIDYRHYEYEQQFKQALQHIDNVDIIIVEGFKDMAIPKIFLMRNSAKIENISEFPAIEALAIDTTIDINVEQCNLPVYDINDIQAICEYIINRFLT